MNERANGAAWAAPTSPAGVPEPGLIETIVAEVLTWNGVSSR